ncbi:unnamed protein product [Coregonus sp. 'balchen']|nr:unnamed protein product [Coregonus sp. 'balchen']
MSKLSFRARALDASKPLPVFRCEDLPDLHEYASINRAVPQMPTGMEKEEESTSTPTAPGPVQSQRTLFKPLSLDTDILMSKPSLHLSHAVAFSLDTEQPDYDLDTEDEAFAVSLQEAKLLLKEDDELIKEVFDYWTRKRKNSKHSTLHPTVKQEKRDGSSTSDPYVAFRRRTEKMQTRKNRKNEEAGYEKMLKLRRDLSRAVTILEMIKRREKSKRELLHLTLEIVEKRNGMSDFGGEIMAEVLAQRALDKPAHIIPLPEKTEVVRQKRKYEKKPKVLPLSAAAPHHSGPSVFNAKDVHQCTQVLQKLRRRMTQMVPLPSGGKQAVNIMLLGWTTGAAGRGSVRQRVVWETLVTATASPPSQVLLDRAHTDFDNVFHGLDSEMLDLPPHSPVTDKFASTSQTNTSDRTSSSYSSSSADLSQILLNIKSSRWRHFRPRTLPLHDGDNMVLVSKTLDLASAQFAASALVTTDQLLALKTKDEGGPVNGVLPPSGVYKGLHLTSTASPSPAAPTSTPSPLTTTPSSPFLLPSTNNNNGTPHTHAANSTTTQVLMGNNNLRLSMSSPGGLLTKRHIPRTLSHAHVAVSSSALKLAATTNWKIGIKTSQH